MDRWIYKVLERSRIPTNIGWLASGQRGMQVEWENFDQKG